MEKLVKSLKGQLLESSIDSYIQSVPMRPFHLPY